MILTCPQCATGYHADESTFPPAGRTVRCRKCRHSWLQRKPEPDSEQVLELTIQTVLDIDWEDPFDGDLILPPAPPTTWAQRWSDAQVTTQSKLAQFKPFVAFAGWGALIGAGGLIALSVMHFGADLTTTLPRLDSFPFFASRKIETHGVEMRNVGYQRETTNGQTMLVLTGTILNSADRTLLVPKTILITVYDENDHQLFHANVSAGAATLGAGESIAFRVRIHDLPSSIPRVRMALQN
jgi:predicted Zn finger-like uncharacterized protein